MLGDPNLNPENQTEWIPLILKCLPCKTLPKHLNVPQDAKCQEHVARRFEEFTIQSTLFQVSGSVESKRKHILKLNRHTEDHRCICSANLSVRMWTTAAEEVVVLPGEGNKKNCAFHAGSTLFKQLVLIPDVRSRFSVMNNSAMLQVEDAREIVAEGSSASNDEIVSELTDGLAPLTQTTALTSPLTSSTNPARMTTMVSPLGTTDEFDNTGGSEDNVLAPRHVSLPSCSIPEHPAFPAIRTPKNLVVLREEEDHEREEAIQEAVVSAEGQQADHIEESRLQRVAKQQSPSVDPLVHGRSRVDRRAPFFSTGIPGRDAHFIGRGELLTVLENILTPSSMPSNDHVSSLDSGGLVMLHGVPGVGKSAIALELIYRIQQSYDHVFWLRANSEVHLARSFHEAAMSLCLVQDRGNYDHESSRLKFLDWLSTTRTTYCLVFDDADQLQVLRRFLPKPRRGSIIVTSRQSHPKGSSIGTDACLQTIEVHPFSLDEATAFLRSFAAYAIDAATASFEADLAASTIIQSYCHYLPLTLRRLGMMIGRRSVLGDRVIMAMLERHAGAELFSQPSSPLIYGYLSSRSDALANVLTFLDPYQIDDVILLGAQRCTEFPLKDFPMTDDDYFGTKYELSSHALLRAGADSLEIHRVTHRSLRNRLDPVRFRQGFHCACKLLEKRWPSRRKMKNVVLGNWPEFDSLHSHVHELSSIYVEYLCRLKDYMSEELKLVNEAYLKILLLSTW